MNIVALDLSLTRTGWATADRCGVLVPPKGSDRGLPRMSWIESEVLSLAESADLTILEELAAFHAQGRAIFDLAGLQWIIRLALHDTGYPFVDVNPSVLKKFATGKGNAPKEEMLTAAVRRLAYQGHDHNEADALWLLQAGLHQYQLPGAVKLPAAQLAALEKVQWPALEVAT